MFEVVLITIVIASFVYLGGGGIVVAVLAVAVWWWRYKGWSRQQDIVENVVYEEFREVALMLSDLDMSENEFLGLPLGTRRQIYEEWKRQKQEQIAKQVAARLARTQAPPASPAKKLPPAKKPPPLDDAPTLPRRPNQTDDQRRVAAEFAAAHKRQRDAVVEEVDVEEVEEVEDAVEAFVHPATAQRRNAEDAHRKFRERQDRERRESFARYMQRRGVTQYNYDAMMRNPRVVQEFEDWRATFDD